METDTHRERSVKTHKVQDWPVWPWGGTSTRREIPKIAKGHQKLLRGMEQTLIRALKAPIKEINLLPPPSWTTPPELPGNPRPFSRALEQPAVTQHRWYSVTLWNKTATDRTSRWAASNVLWQTNGHFQGMGETGWHFSRCLQKSTSNELEQNWITGRDRWARHHPGTLFENECTRHPSRTPSAAHTDRELGFSSSQFHTWTYWTYKSLVGAYLLLRSKTARGVLFLKNALKVFQAFLTSQYTWARNQKGISFTPVSIHGEKRITDV